MKKNLLSISVATLNVVFSTLNSSAQPTYGWAHSISDNGSQCYASNSMAVDADGNVYIVGDFWATADFDPGPATANLTPLGLYDFFIAKYDASGNYLWAKQIGGAGSACMNNDITLDELGNIYITGAFWTGPPVDFDPGAGTANLTSAGGWDICFAKYDNDGNYIWAKSVGGTAVDVAYSLVVDLSGNTYITGRFQGTSDFDPGAGIHNLTASNGAADIYFAKYDNLGNYMWANIITSGWGQGVDIDIDNTGNVYITGFFMGTGDFDPGPATAFITGVFPISNIYFAKYDNNGNYIWAYNIESTFWTQSGIGTAIDVDGTGNVYLTGGFSDTVDFDPGAATQNLFSVGGTSDIFIAKYNTNGNYVWAYNIGSTSADVAYDIIFDGQSNVCITGNFEGTADFDPGAGITNLTSAGLQDVFFARYDNNGNYLCAGSIGGTGDDNGYDIAAYGAHNICIAGQFNGTSDFDPGPGMSNLTSASSCDIFFGKFTWCLPTEIEALATINDISIYPNPSSGKFSVVAGSSRINAIEIYDMRGDPINIGIQKNKSDEIDLSGFPNGIYFIKVQQDDKMVVKKIVKM